MYEAIVTIVVPATENEPAHTEIHRFEFEHESDLKCALSHMEGDCVSHEQLLAGFHEAAGS